MVKGISRRVVVVHPSDSTVFEQAIFVIKDKANPSNDILREACVIAEQYLGKPRIKRYVRKRWTNTHLFFAWLTGAGLVSTIWAATNIFSISLF